MQCIEAGGDDFLPKPLKMEKLLERLQEHLQLELVFEADGTLIDDHAMDVPVELGQITLPSGHRTVLVELA